MNDDPTPDRLQGLPEDLAELDRELRGIQMSERPSFAPELRAELEREWIREDGRFAEPAATGGLGRAAAAAAVALFLVSLSVPQARGSLADLSRRALHSVGVLDERSPTPVETTPAFVPDDPGLLAAPSTRESGVRASPGLRPFEIGQPDSELPSLATEEPPPFRGIPATFPELEDRAAEQEAVRRYYPDGLQRRGVGGTVHLQLWVDSTGRVDNVHVRRGSGEPALNAAAMLAANDLRFRPATRGGVPVGTWVEFDVVFEPGPAETALPTVRRVEEPGAPADLEGPLLEAWSPDAVISPPINMAARDLLRSALGGQPDAPERVGSLEGLLRGVPPTGVSPLAWRADATDVLERAMARNPDNPAPYLALGRILKRQGLRAEALALFERGIERSGRRVGPASSELAAELHYERGMLLRDGWLAWSSLGTVAGSAEPPRCARTAAATDPVSAEALIAVNFLCPAAFEHFLDTSFRPLDAGVDSRGMMRGAFERAIEADPGHVGANIEILLDLAASGSWYELLNGARRFAWGSRGHPHALLLSGLALHRLGRSEEALEEFETAFRNLPEEQIRALEEIRPLLTEAEAAAFDALDEAARAEAVVAFWSGRDPILTTRVNELRVEHFARGTHALLRFGGVDTDAGETWVRYGAPLVVRTVGGGTDLRTEFWDYGRAPHVTFRRPAMSAALELTPEARAYLDDLRSVVPHRYGTRGRPVLALETRMSRFRGRAGGTEVEIRGRVPAPLRRAEDLRVGLFATSRDGEVLERRVEGVSGPDFRATFSAPAGADAVVVELYDPDKGEAAAARTGVPRGASGLDDPGISDLLLLEAGAPMERNLTRREGWFVPLGDGPVPADRVGVFFELYRLPDADAPYTVRVEAVPEGEGAPLEVPYRPSGQTLFSPSWSRRAVLSDGVAGEYLTLDLERIPEGSYTLRVSVELPGELPAVVATAPLLRTVEEGGATSAPTPPR